MGSKTSADITGLTLKLMQTLMTLTIQDFYNY